MCARAGIKGVTFHDLRGCAVTRLALAGCSVSEIATITGHSLADVEAILDAHYLGRTVELVESATNFAFALAPPDAKPLPSSELAYRSHSPWPRRVLKPHVRPKVAGGRPHCRWACPTAARLPTRASHNALAIAGPSEGPAILRAGRPRDSASCVVSKSGLSGSRAHNRLTRPPPQVAIRRTRRTEARKRLVLVSGRRRRGQSEPQRSPSPPARCPLALGGRHGRQPGEAAHLKRPVVVRFWTAWTALTTPLLFL